MQPPGAAPAAQQQPQQGGYYGGPAAVQAPPGAPAVAEPAPPGRARWGPWSAASGGGGAAAAAQAKPLPPIPTSAGKFFFSWVVVAVSVPRSERGGHDGCWLVFMIPSGLGGFVWSVSLERGMLGRRSR